MRTPVTIATLTIATLFALPASAGHVEFHYNSSELASAAGAKRLYERIEQQAENVCSTHDARELWRARASETCAALTVNDVIDAIGDPGLRAIHAEAEQVKFAAR